VLPSSAFGLTRWSEDNMKRKIMDTSSSYIFEVVFRDIPVLGQTHGASAKDRSIIVEIEPDNIAQTATNLPSGEAVRQRSNASKSAVGNK